MKKSLLIISLAMVCNSTFAYDCRSLYNEITQLGKELNSTRINRYSQSSVDNYNQKIQLINQLSYQFNTYCVNQRPVMVQNDPVSQVLNSKGYFEQSIESLNPQMNLDLMKFNAQMQLEYDRLKSLQNSIYYNPSF